VKRIVLAAGLISLLIGVTIISISSIRVPDPLHTSSSVYNGKINNDTRAVMLLKDIQKGKNISLSVTPQNTVNVFNIKIINSKGTVLFDLNSSQPLFTTITPPISGNYSAVLTNLKNEDTYTQSIFASSVLFDSNKNPKIEINTILIGVIILLIGIVICIIWILLEFFERLKERTRYRQLS
jgi:hypothetical protein